MNRIAWGVRDLLILTVPTQGTHGELNGSYKIFIRFQNSRCVRYSRTRARTRTHTYAHTHKNTHTQMCLRMCMCLCVHSCVCKPCPNDETNVLLMSDVRKKKIRFFFRWNFYPIIWVNIDKTHITNLYVDNDKPAVPIALALTERK